MEFVSNGMIIGVDEVGKGSWAGPMVVVAFAAPKDWAMQGLKDSKQYEGHKERKKIYNLLHGEADCLWATQFVEAQDIDEVGMRYAHPKAVKDAIEVVMGMLRSHCEGIPERIIVDGNGPQPFYGVECIPKADALFPQVSAASVVAKVLHDEQMIIHAARYTGYGFEKNMGYGTSKHSAGILASGLCPIHRRSFAPIKNYLSHGSLVVPLEDEQSSAGSADARDAGATQLANGDSGNASRRAAPVRRRARAIQSV